MPSSFSRWAQKQVAFTKKRMMVHLSRIRIVSVAPNRAIYSAVLIHSLCVIENPKVHVLTVARCAYGFPFPFQVQVLTVARCAYGFPIPRVG